MLTLDLVWPAEPEWVPAGVGVFDTSLSDMGMAQAEWLGFAYADDRITHYYVSSARAEESTTRLPNCWVENQKR